MAASAGPRTEELIEWFDQRIDVDEGINLPVMEREAQEAFSDPQWNAELAKELKIELFRTVAQRRIAATRPGGVITMRDQVISRDEHNRRATVMEANMVKWREKALGLHHRLGAMRRRELEAAIKTRRSRVTSELMRIEYFEKLMERLTDENTTVEEVWTEEELAEEWNKIVMKHRGYGQTEEEDNDD
jgi:hypothetical protein